MESILLQDTGNDAFSLKSEHLTSQAAWPQPRKRPSYRSFLSRYQREANRGQPLTVQWTVTHPPISSPAAISFHRPTGVATVTLPLGHGELETSSPQQHRR